MAQKRYFPDVVQAGETVWISAASVIDATKNDLVFDDFTPAGGYALSYSFGASTPITVAAVANSGNTGWTLEVTAAQTLAWRAGSMQYNALVTHTATQRVYVVEFGTVRVLPSPLATSSWTAVVAACDAAMLTYSGNPNSSISVDGMTISYRSLENLTNLRAYAREMELAEKQHRPRIIRARFT